MTVLAITAAALFVATLHITTHHSIERRIVSVQDQINAVVDQLRKAKDEIVGQLAAAHNNLHTQLVDAGVAEEVDLSALTAIARQLDDIVPDAPAEPAVEDLEDPELTLDDETEPADLEETDEEEE